MKIYLQHWSVKQQSKRLDGIGVHVAGRPLSPNNIWQNEWFICIDGTIQYSGPGKRSKLEIFDNYCYLEGLRNQMS